MVKECYYATKKGCKNKTWTLLSTPLWFKNGRFSSRATQNAFLVSRAVLLNLGEDWLAFEDCIEHVRKKKTSSLKLSYHAKILFPLLHFKLGVCKQFRAVNKHGDFLKPICKTISVSRDEKLKGGIFNEPQIRYLMKDPNFITVMAPNESWSAENFLGNPRSSNYKDLVQKRWKVSRHWEQTWAWKPTTSSHLSQFP